MPEVGVRQFLNGTAIEHKQVVGEAWHLYKKLSFFSAQALNSFRLNQQTAIIEL